MEIKQLQVGYNDAQDRLVLRINIDQDKFANLVLTRRVCRFMLDQIGPFLRIADGVVEDTAGQGTKPRRKSRKKKADEAVAVVPDNLKPAGEQVDDEETGAEKPVTVKPDYQTPFEERNPAGNIFGVGAAWPVVVNAGCSQQDDRLTFVLQFENQQTMNLTLSEPLAKGLFRLVYDLAERIQWFGGVSLVPAKPAASEPADAPTPPKNSVTYH